MSVYDEHAWSMAVSFIIIYIRKKETAMCREHIDGTVVHVLREIMPECVLKLVRGLNPYPPDTPYLAHRWW